MLPTEKMANVRDSGVFDDGIMTGYPVMPHVPTRETIDWETLCGVFSSGSGDACVFMARG
jgi:hypothetical protein